jgi:hypothetical protein
VGGLWASLGVVGRRWASLVLVGACGGLWASLVRIARRWCALVRIGARCTSLVHGARVCQGAPCARRWCALVRGASGLPCVHPRNGANVVGKGAGTSSVTAFQRCASLVHGARWYALLRCALRAVARRFCALWRRCG